MIQIMVNHGNHGMVKITNNIYKITLTSPISHYTSTLNISNNY